ncbi:hypothetical protein QEL91_005663 [Pseudomonas putida]|nr:hypothetical protein [Pseudomonas putida]
MVKSNLFGVVDWDGLKEQGTGLAAVFLMDRVYALIAKEPTQDNAEARNP